MLDHVGLRPPRRRRPPRDLAGRRRSSRRSCRSRSRSRRPLELADETREHVLARPVPAVRRSAGPRRWRASWCRCSTTSRCTRLALESVLANTDEPPYEVVVVDNGSARADPEYLEVLAARNRHVRVIRNDENRGFAAACNQGLDGGRAARSWSCSTTTRSCRRAGSPGSSRHLEDAEDRARRPGDQSLWRRRPDPTSLRDLRRDARLRPSPPARAAPERAGDRHRCRGDVLRRDAPRRSSRRSGRSTSASRSACSRTTTTCAGSATPATGSSAPRTLFVHHFGEASLGELAARRALRGALPREPPPLRGEVGGRLGAARPPRRPGVRRARRPGQRRRREHVPSGATVLVVSSGDDDAGRRSEDREGWHFPQLDDGTYAGQHPADDAEAIAELERLRERGAEVPRAAGDRPVVARPLRGVPRPPGDRYPALVDERGHRDDLRSTDSSRRRGGARSRHERRRRPSRSGGRWSPRPALPEIDRDSGSQQVDLYIRWLLERGWSVTFVATETDGDAAPRPSPAAARASRPTSATTRRRT